MPSTTDAPGTDAAPPKPAKAAKTSQKSLRRRSRELALQGLYEWLLSREKTSVISSHMREQANFDPCDAEHFDALLGGCIDEAAQIDAALARHVDRKISELSPVEHGVLMIGVYELMHCIDIPYRVVINEAVELAKSFGGTDGHKFVNGVIDKTAADLRAVEVEAARAARR
ncbi:MAG: N utilization substance protein B [Burkholderiales bacterium 28-67-8]|nr:MAG: N utilization substance protein B [Burkholderiales bacterium 28-67-8]